MPLLSCCQSKSGTEPDRLSEDSGDENMKRGNWSGRLDFLMSCISYAVGLGNIWRFPYLCYRNGGASFLIPYLTFLALCGMPLFFLEVSYGQFASLGPISVWRMSPLFKGIGWGMILISGIVCIYYNIIIAWTLYYLFMSFSPTLPWSTCDNSWNTEQCALKNRSWSEVNASSFDDNVTLLATVATNVSALKRTTPSEEFWSHHVLKITSGIDDVGGIRWELLGCLALAWFVVFLCLIKGIKSSGKVVYFTATFPYIVLLTLLIRGVTLPGSLEGIKFYVIPQWDKLLSLKVWGEAAMQIFYSIGAGWGALITFASYNKFHNDCYRDARIIPILNSGTSVFAGFVIFSIIGFMAHETGESVENVITEGPGLVFVVYPAAVARLPVSQFWSILFFLMLFSVGIGSQFGMFQTMTSGFSDEFKFLQTPRRKLLLTAALCIFEFLVGIICITEGGIYFFQIIDWYSSTFSLMIISLTETLVIMWIYGAEMFYKDLELMIGYKPCLWWRILWSGVTPAIILFVFIFTAVLHSPVTYGDYEYPSWAIGLGWVFAICSIVPLPGIAIYKMVTTDGTFLQRLKKLVHAAPEWGPAVPQHREEWLRSHGRTYGNFLEASELEKLNDIKHEEIEADLRQEKPPIV
ncbi:hypothetical protein CAPTEDRAFT_153408 [Capitella teleta]|uniref:Transporter n=1 Tax=Capitella teleta TaxID=283909 RepID=R7VDI4_CAPTE|nr:hypothetical protein CAPTEDRAFT_153408 [Capitella teleta]|eukprot:ELU16913.1 hypothetical protein CAPTEDRAFT_153408 [Capitella teleta]